MIDFKKMFSICLSKEELVLIRFCCWQHLPTTVALWGGHIIFAFSGIRHLASAITLGFRSFQGNVFIRCLPNLVWVFIGLIACMGLLLVKIAV